MVAPAASQTEPPRRQRRAYGAALAWAGLILAAWLVGENLYDEDWLIRVGAPPLVGSYDLRAGALALPAVALGAAGVALAPALAARLRFGVLLGASWAGSVAWALALAVSDGGGAISKPLESRYEYLTAVPLVGDNPFSFLSGYVDALPTYATHVRGHPPGMVLLLWSLDQIGLGGAQAAAFVVIAVGALAAPAVLVTLRELVGETLARTAAPFLVLLPAAVWVATSADALFAGVLACGAALFALATGRHDRAGDGLAIGAGMTLGAGLALSYSAGPFGAIVLAIALLRRRVRPLALAAAGVIVVLGSLGLAGFWWHDGLAATRDIALDGVQSRRPYAEFVLISVAAFALALGPATAAGLTRIGDRATRFVVCGALVAVGFAALSGLSRGETERIWLPFAPWLALAAAGLGRGWLAAQVGLALVIQLAVRSPW